MMLHRHFEKEKSQGMTTLADVTPKAKKEVAPEDFPPVEPVGAPKKRSRAKKAE